MENDVPCSDESSVSNASIKLKSIPITQQSQTVTKSLKIPKATSTDVAKDVIPSLEGGQASIQPEQESLVQRSVPSTGVRDLKSISRARSRRGRHNANKMPPETFQTKHSASPPSSSLSNTVPQTSIPGSYCHRGPDYVEGLSEDFPSPAFAESPVRVNRHESSNHAISVSTTEIPARIHETDSMAIEAVKVPDMEVAHAEKDTSGRKIFIILLGVLILVAAFTATLVVVLTRKEENAAHPIDERCRLPKDALTVPYIVCATIQQRTSPTDCFRTNMTIIRKK